MRSRELTSRRPGIRERRPPRSIAVMAALLLIGAIAMPARAADPEGCLTCHQYRGLSRVTRDGKTVSLFYVNPNYYSMALGPHAHLKCTDCHNQKEVNVFPHEPVSPVDCSRMCHIVSPGKVETRFSHDRIGRMLGGSVHGAKVLDESNKLLDSPLKTGQARCLLCHDEPTFRRTGQSWIQQQAPVERCDSCHDEQLPKDTKYAYWHVHARSEPARSNLDMARLCATCHSNSAVRQAYKLPDATASYLGSFHGKAAQLGSSTTPGCLECHVGQRQNVHTILAHSNPIAPTSIQNSPDTCRKPECHRAAGAQISSAAIHQDLAATGGVEFLIACVFIVLIIFTFGPSLLLTALKMFHVVIGREDPALHGNVHRLHKLLDTPDGRKKLMRFNVHQRVQHWYLVVCFTTLCLTGFPLKFADHAWAAWVIRTIGGLATARILHRWAGGMLIFGFLYHIVYVILTIRRRKRESGKSLFKVILGLPMAVGPEDQKHMLHLLLYLLGLRRHRPNAGRFNAEEKFEYIGVFWGTFVLGVTGLGMWFSSWTSRHLPGRALTIATLIHTFEAFLALLHVGVVHMVGVIFSPGSFPVSKAMFTGETPVEEMAEAHAGMIDDVERELGAGAPAAQETAEVIHE